MQQCSLLFAIGLALMQVSSSAQCAPAASATASITLAGQPGGTENRSGLAFNPQLGFYYSVNAGSGNYPLDTYNEDGSLAATVISGFDYRGVWWEPTTSRLIGNGYATLGIFDQALAVGTGLPLGSGTVLFTGNQPDVQSIGDLDTDANEIIYYSADAIHRYSASTNAPLGTYAISGLPVATSNLNSNTVMYIGCPGIEIALYDFVNRQVLFVNKTTGAYSGATQLPVDAPQRASFGLSYANGKVWLYDQGFWRGYDLGFTLSVTETSNSSAVRMWPNPAADQVQLEWSAVRGRLELVIADMSGREVMREQFDGTAGIHGFDVSAVAPGSYCVQLRHGSILRSWPLVIAR